MSGLTTQKPDLTATRAERQRREGILLVDKPAGCTSHDVVARARRALGVKRIGHAGTLDPCATGLLVLLVGRVTRLAAYLDGEPKVYDAVVRFGSETSSDDATGHEILTAPLPVPDAIRAGIVTLTGPIEQRPPAVSAKQVGGVRAHAAARRGAPLELKSVQVTVHEWQIGELSPERVVARVTCSGGTYVRALARDLGRLAGSAAHLESLRRVRSGPFTVGDACLLDAIDAATVLRSPLSGMPGTVVETLSADDVMMVQRGRAVDATQAGERAALVDAAGDVIAIAVRDGTKWQPRVVLVDE